MVMMAALMVGVVISLSFMIYGPNYGASVELVTSPDGAEIYVGEERVGQTPHRLELPSSASGVEVVFKKEGFKDVVRKIEAADSREKVEVELEKRAEW